MRLGSLFDGSGGFPLAGIINGITPVWASEIEPYPLRVTAARLPEMTQLGDVTKINGAKVEPVDIITFGSPCQDLSVAGAQKGIHEGERSSLFFEAIRIIKEMREHDRANGRPDEHCRPRFAVWENVPGAFSSNKGKDFQAVLQAFCEVCGKAVSVPEPPKGKWANAGCIVGDGYSIAWRVYDAQYWGVLQRRKRIYLVADFASERAGEILFESEGVCGYPAQSAEEGQGTAEDAEGSAGRSSGVVCLNPWDSQTIRQYSAEGVFPALSANNNGGGRREGVCAPVGIFMGGQGEKAGGIGYSEDVSPTIKSVLSGSNTVPDVVYACNAKQQSLNVVGNHANTLGANDYKEPQVVVYPEVARTLTAEHDASPCIDRGQNFVCCPSSFGAYVEGVGTLKANGGDIGGDRRHWSCFDCRGNGSGKVVPTMTGDHQNRVTDYTAVAVHPKTTGTLCANSHPGSYTGQDAFNDMLPVVPSDKPSRKYIVRRLTPLECCRLQGFPDWWEDGVEGSDSARYKMWGNGIALPCAVDVLRRIAKENVYESHLD